MSVENGRGAIVCGLTTLTRRFAMIRRIEKKAESQAHQKYEAYKAATSVQEARALGATTPDLKFDHQRQFLSLLTQDDAEGKAVCGEHDHEEGHEAHKGEHHEEGHEAHEEEIEFEDDVIMEPEDQLDQPCGPEAARDVTYKDLLQLREITVFQWAREGYLRGELDRKKLLVDLLKRRLLKSKKLLVRLKVEKRILAGYVKHAGKPRGVVLWAMDLVGVGKKVQQQTRHWDKVLVVFSFFLLLDECGFKTPAVHKRCLGMTGHLGLSFRARYCFAICVSTRRNALFSLAWGGQNFCAWRLLTKLPQNHPNKP